MSSATGKNEEKRAGTIAGGAGLSTNAGTAQGWANEQYGKNNQMQDFMFSGYKDLYNQAGAGGGSTGGGGYTPQAYTESETSPFWHSRMAGEGDDFENMRFGLGGKFKTAVGDYGLTGEAGYNDIMRQGAAGNAAQFGSLSRNLQNSGAISGSAGPGFSEQNLALAAQGARAGNANSLSSRIALAQKIADEQKWGAEQGAAGAGKAIGEMNTGAGQVRSLELDKRAWEDQERQRAAAAANAGAANDRERYAMQMGALSGMGNLRSTAGSDLQYLNSSNQAYGGSAGVYQNLQLEKPWWEKQLDNFASFSDSYANMATGGISGIAGGKK